MKIKGYEFEVTEFVNETDAGRALETARLEDKPIMGGKVICIPWPDHHSYIVHLYNETEMWYL